MLCYPFVSSLLIVLAAANSCPCGWKVKESGEVYTHRIFNDFSTLPDNDNLLATKPNSDNSHIRLNAKYEAKNVKVRNGTLEFLQNGYGDANLAKFDPVHIAGIQTKTTNILHGTFRAEMKLEGYDGGSCASFFWYHDDRSELDIEAVTPGTSLVNDTINYTSHPSVNLDGSKIANATLSIPLQKTFDAYKVHRFDCDVQQGVKYYLNDKLMHTDRHNVPREGGSLQIKLWADGNKWWSGMPSKTDTFLRVKSVIAYFNTTSSPTNITWRDRCAREKQQCEAIFDVGAHKGEKSVPCGRGHPCPSEKSMENSRDSVTSALSASLPSATSLLGSDAFPFRSEALSSYRGRSIQLIVSWIGLLTFTITR